MFFFKNVLASETSSSESSSEKDDDNRHDRSENDSLSAPSEVTPLPPPTPPLPPTDNFFSSHPANSITEIPDSSSTFSSNAFSQPDNSKEIAAAINAAINTAATQRPSRSSINLTQEPVQSKVAQTVTPGSKPSIKAPYPPLIANTKEKASVLAPSAIPLPSLHDDLSDTSSEATELQKSPRTLEAPEPKGTLRSKKLFSPANLGAENLFASSVPDKRGKEGPKEKADPPALKQAVATVANLVVAPNKAAVTGVTGIGPVSANTMKTGGGGVGEDNVPRTNMPESVKTPGETLGAIQGKKEEGKVEEKNGEGNKGTKSSELLYYERVVEEGKVIKEKTRELEKILWQLANVRSSFSDKFLVAPAPPFPASAVHQEILMSRIADEIRFCTRTSNLGRAFAGYIKRAENLTETEKKKILERKGEISRIDEQHMLEFNALIARATTIGFALGRIVRTCSNIERRQKNDFFAYWHQKFQFIKKIPEEYIAKQKAKKLHQKKAAFIILHQKFEKIKHQAFHDLLLNAVSWSRYPEAFTEDIVHSRYEEAMAVHQIAEHMKMGLKFVSVVKRNHQKNMLASLFLWHQKAQRKPIKK